MSDADDDPGGQSFDMKGKWPVVGKIVTAIALRHAGRAWPRGDANETTKDLKIVHNFIGAVSDNQHKDLILRYLNGRRRTKLKAEVVKELLADIDTQLLLNLKEIVNTCSEHHNEHRYNDIRINILKALVGIKGKGRKELFTSEFKFGTRAWQTATRERAECGLADVYLQELHKGRLSIDQLPTSHPTTKHYDYYYRYSYDYC